MTRATLHRWTHDDLARLPEDGKRYEIIAGELCMTAAPSTRHQGAVVRLVHLLRAFVDARGLGELYVAPVDVRLTEHDVVEPDVLLVCTENLGIVEEAFISGAPDLVIEVTSDSTRGRDRGAKKELYESAGVREYWIVDSDAERITVYRRTGRSYGPGLDLDRNSVVTTPLLPGFELPVADVFAAPQNPAS